MYGGSFYFTSFPALIVSYPFDNTGSVFNTSLYNYVIQIHDLGKVTYSVSQGSQDVMETLNEIFEAKFLLYLETELTLVDLEDYLCSFLFLSSASIALKKQPKSCLVILY